MQIDINRFEYTVEMCFLLCCALRCGHCYV